MPHLILWAYGAVPELCFYKEFDLFFLWKSPFFQKIFKFLAIGLIVLLMGMIAIFKWGLFTCFIYFVLLYRFCIISFFINT
jgi:hypothetical protein